MSHSRWAVAACSRVLGLLFIGCATTTSQNHYDLPLTQYQVAFIDRADALVAYLGQDDASASVCDPTASTRHLTTLDTSPDVRFAPTLIKALLDGTVAPAPCGRCIEAYLTHAAPDRADALLEALAPLYRKLLTDPRLETDPVVADRLSVLHRLYVERNPGLQGDPRRVEPMLGDLREALAKSKTLGPVATRFGTELLAAVDLERGQWQGKPVDLALMDSLVAQGVELTLKRFALRLPDPSLREEARRRIVRVHIARSPYPELRANAEAVEAAVLKDGFYAVSLGEHAVQHAALEDKGPRRTVQVAQDLQTQSASLLSVSVADGNLTAMPELELRDMLSVTVLGFSRPIRMCGEPGELDVTPCFAASDVTSDNPLAFVDPGGTVRFRDALDFATELALARSTTVSIPLRLGKASALELTWPLVFRRPDDLTFQAATGQRGPNVNVRVDRIGADRWLFEASSPTWSHLSAIVENSDVSLFHTGSVGGTGPTGIGGMDGSDGSDGSECRDGSDGTNGSDGGPGGQGGDGGDMHVTVACTTTCPEALPLLRRVVISAGGDGGPGGRGGRAGRGGTGGSNRLENTDTGDRGCFQGSPGRDGLYGTDGPTGAPGRPGTVRFDPQH